MQALACFLRHIQALLTHVLYDVGFAFFAGSHKLYLCGCKARESRINTEIAVLLCGILIDAQFLPMCGI